LSSIHTPNALKGSLVIWDHTVLPARGDSPDFTLAFLPVLTLLSCRRWKAESAKAVYRSGCCDKHKAAVGFDPLIYTPQSSILPLDHCDNDWMKKYMEYEVESARQEVDQRKLGERLWKKTVRCVD